MPLFLTSRNDKARIGPTRLCASLHTCDGITSGVETGVECRFAVDYEQIITGLLLYDFLTFNSIFYLDSIVIQYNCNKFNLSNLNVRLK